MPLGKYRNRNWSELADGVLVWRPLDNLDAGIGQSVTQPNLPPLNSGQFQGDKPVWIARRQRVRRNRAIDRVEGWLGKSKGACTDPAIAPMVVNGRVIRPDT